jgi:hypothetical protein
MSDKKISQLDSSTIPLNGSEVLPIVQNGVTKQVTVDNLTAGKGVSLTGITITGTGGRIRGDFSNATQANRVMFQNSTTNAATPVGAIPNGTATQANFTAYNSSDPTNASVARMSINTTTDMRLDSSITGTGTYLPLTMWTGGSERVHINTSGEVCVAGNADNGAYNLQCNGTGVWGAGAYVNGSDERIKDNIAPLDSGLDVVTKLNPVTYKYKEGWSKDQSTQTGFIAQELLTALNGKNYVNGVVQQNSQYMSVAYQNIIPILTKAIQELNEKLEAQSKEIAELKGLL